MNKLIERIANSLLVTAQLALPWQMTCAATEPGNVEPNDGIPGVESPKFGSPERTALLNCLRGRQNIRDLASQWNVQKIVFFKVTNLVKNDWAFVSAIPGNNDGTKKNEPLNAVLRRTDGQWEFVVYAPALIATMDNPNESFKKWQNHFLMNHQACPADIFPATFYTPANREFASKTAAAAANANALNASNTFSASSNSSPNGTGAANRSNVLNTTNTLATISPINQQQRFVNRTTTTTTTVHPSNVTLSTSSSSAVRSKLFFDTVKANFSSWDANGDGTLDRSELEIAAQNPKFTGDSAVALAVLKNSVDSSFKDDKIVTFKVADIDDLSGKSEAGEKLNPDYGRRFVSISEKMRTQPKQLFTGSLPHLFAIHQGATSDCYFLSSVGGLIESNPRSIVDMIKLGSDGNYIVTFPGKAGLKVPVPTETEMAAYSDAKDGYWLNVLEKAYGSIRHLKSGLYTAEPMDAMALYGGSCPEIIKLITGHNVRTLQFQPKGPHALSPEEVVASARQALADGFSKHEIITTGKEHHAYTVTEYDATADTVTIHNPYGNDGTMRWADGTKGPSVVNGYFTIPVSDFVKYFRGLSYETI